MKATDNNIREVEQLEDGSSVYEIGEPLQEKLEEKEEGAFYKNLAEKFPEEARKKLSSFLLDAIEEDIDSRQEWMDAIERPYLGFSIEDLKDMPFKMATRTYDTTLATALIKLYSIVRAEALPQTGPAGFLIEGQSTEELEAIGKARIEELNKYLTITDKPYYSDFERFIISYLFEGTGFKKVYENGSMKGPICRYITLKDFVINSDCTSILDSTRLTHILHLSKREIMLNQQNGIYRDVELPYLKSGENIDEDELVTPTNDDVDVDVYTRRSLFPIYEVHTYLNLDDFTNNSANDNKSDSKVPLPYIVTIDKISKEILSMQKNWKEKDEEQKRINHFIQYNCLPGFGIFGFGLAHLGGANAISLTRILRQLIDAGAFKNLPGGLRAKGFKQQQNDLIVGPGQFIEVDTGGIALKEAFLPLPYSGPDGMYRELMMGMAAQTKELCAIGEMGIQDSKAAIPAATTIELMEEINRVRSTILSSFHYSLTEELQLIDSLLEGGRAEITIIPISDPSMNSTMQRRMRADAILKTAMQFPEQHNPREVLKINYEALGLDGKEIDKILVPVQQEQEILPLDPISENLNMMKGIPVKTAIWQEHDAHILTHAVFAENNPDLKPVILSHIKDHKVDKYQIQMQQMLGIELPPLDQLTNPEVQNTIAMAIADALEQSGMTQTADQEAPIDPNALLMADIQQKEAETAARERIANLKAETDVFKAQLDFEKEKAKIESSEDIAKLKSETELIKQGVVNE